MASPSDQVYTQYINSIMSTVTFSEVLDLLSNLTTASRSRLAELELTVGGRHQELINAASIMKEVGAMVDTTVKENLSEVVNWRSLSTSNSTSTSTTTSISPQQLSTIKTFRLLRSISTSIHSLSFPSAWRGFGEYCYRTSPGSPWLDCFLGGRNYVEFRKFIEGEEDDKGRFGEVVRAREEGRTAAVVSATSANDDDHEFAPLWPYAQLIPMRIQNSIFTFLTSYPLDLASTTSSTTVRGALEVFEEISRSSDKTLKLGVEGGEGGWVERVRGGYYSSTSNSHNNGLNSNNNTNNTSNTSNTNNLNLNLMSMLLEFRMTNLKSIISTETVDTATAIAFLALVKSITRSISLTSNHFNEIFNKNHPITPNVTSRKLNSWMAEASKEVTSKLLNLVVGQSEGITHLRSEVVAICAAESSSESNSLYKTLFEDFFNDILVEAVTDEIERVGGQMRVMVGRVRDSGEEASAGGIYAMQITNYFEESVTKVIVSLQEQSSTNTLNLVWDRVCRILR